MKIIYINRYDTSYILPYTYMFFDLDANEDIIDQIYEDEYDFLDSDKNNNQYYIGAHKHYLLACAITPKSFTKFKFNDVRAYLRDYSSMYIRRPKIDIMKLIISDEDEYKVVIKTYWIRLIQRHWKKRYEEREKIIRKRTSISSIRYKELRGRYNYGLNYIPNLNGLLNEYT